MVRLLDLVAFAGGLATSLALTDFAKNNVRKHFGDNRLIVLPLAELNDVVHEIFEEHSFDDVGHHDGKMHVKLSPEAVAALNEEGVSFSDHTEEFLSNMERNLNSENFMCMEGAEACASKSQDEYYTSYQTIDTIYARFEGYAAAHPDTTSWETLGITYEGREQKVFWIGDQTKPLVYYFCTIHAREWITPMFCSYMAETLLDPTNPDSVDALSKFSFAITPVGNPDGYFFSYTENTAWRKTRKPNIGSTCIGTDPNRNYAVGWGGPGATTDPCSNIYHGRAPFDNPCTFNIKNFTDTYQDRLVHVNDVHAYGEYWMSPWAGTTELPPAEDYDKQNTCNIAVRDAILDISGLDFTIGPVATAIYLAAGGSVDYFYGQNGVIHSYTYEARGGGLSGLAGFQPPPENIIPSNIELFGGLIAALDVIYRLELAEPTPFPTSSPVECVDMVPNGIFFADGSPAPCDEIEAYCPEYEVVRERCRATCNTDGCAEGAVRQKFMDAEANLEAVVIDRNAATSGKEQSGLTLLVVAVAAAVGAVVLAIGAAVVVVRRRQPRDGEEQIEVAL